MKAFFVTLGKGILYFILFPFALIFISLYGVYLFFLNIFTFFGEFKKKKSMKKYVSQLDEKAMNILKGNKYVEESAPQQISSNVTNNNIVITNKEDLMNLVRELKQEEKVNEIPQNDPKLITDESTNCVIEEKPLVVRGENVKRVK